MASFINVTHTHTHKKTFTSEDEVMSVDKITTLEAALNLLEVITIFSLTVFIMESFYKEPDHKDKIEKSHTPEPHEPKAKKNKKE
jgi:hypothetical protein